MNFLSPFSFPKNPWVTVALLSYPFWSVIFFFVLLGIVNQITSNLFGFPLYTVLPKGRVLTEWWMISHLVFWIALFFWQPLDKRICALLPISWYLVFFFMLCVNMTTRGSLDASFERGAGRPTLHSDIFPGAVLESQPQ